MKYEMDATPYTVYLYSNIDTNFPINPTSDIILTRDNTHNEFIFTIFGPLEQYLVTDYNIATGYNITLDSFTAEIRLPD